MSNKLKSLADIYFYNIANDFYYKFKYDKPHLMDKYCNSQE